MIAKRTGRIAYLMKRYPRLSETFILNEIAGMEDLGTELELFTLLQPEPPPHHPMVAQIRASLHHLPRGLIAKAKSVLVAHARCLWRTPFRYVTALGRAARLSVLSGRPLNTWKQYLRAAFVADRCVDLEIGLIHAHFANTPAAVAWFASAMTGIPFSVTTHAKDLYLTTRGALRAVMRDAKFVATCTRYNADYLKTVVANGDHGKIHVVYHGVALRRFGMRAQAAATSEEGRPPLILSVGRLVPKKGFSDLLAACRILQQDGIGFRCVIVGEGPLRARLQEEIALHRLVGVVELVGSLTHADLIKLYAQADVFALTPRIVSNGDRDGIPNVIAEAMATGVPVLSTSISGIPELVRNDYSGLLVPPGSPSAIAAALKKLLGDELVRERLAREGRNKVEQCFDGSETIKVLRALMHASTASRAPDLEFLAAEPVAMG
jgi:glycosyltransferase involved in cell wall biosynthesis